MAHIPADRFFEIRFESIGGLGAHAAGQVLASAAVLRMGMNGAHFSSYGSEKKGSLVRSFVRLGPADRPIRTSAPVETPDGIVVFHTALLRNPATLGGLRKDGVFIFNAPAGSTPEVLTDLPKTARAARVDALGIAVEEKSRPNAVLLGTLCAVFPTLNKDAVLEALTEEFSGKHPEAVASNTRAFKRGAAELEICRSSSRSRSGATRPSRRAASSRNRATRRGTICRRRAPAGFRSSMTTSASTAAPATWCARTSASYGATAPRAASSNGC
jgi:2-oxoacid:acceptor oxidoreductase gamma subunit (pyruvate/2-ketoisovalerate family)